MKYLFVLVFVLFNHLNADEMQRIESIVKDITKLRLDSIKSEEALDLCTVSLKDEEEKNTILHSELKLYSNFTQTERNYKKEIEKLKKELRKVNNLLKIKQNSLKKTFIPLSSLSDDKLKLEKCLNSQTVLDDNPFPQLKMKKEFEENKEVEQKVEFFTASSFRVNKDSNIYDGLNGVKTDVWDKDTSFTSNQKTKDWIKVTGYFVDKIWQKSKKELWIKTIDVIQREQGSLQK